MKDSKEETVTLAIHKNVVEKKNDEIMQLTNQIEFMGNQIMKKDALIRKFEEDNKALKVIHQYDDQGYYMGFYCPKCNTFHVFTGCRCCADKSKYCYECGAKLDTKEE